MEIVIASANVHKIRELRDLCKAFEISFDILSLLNFPDYIPPEEIGKSFEENAILKAQYAAANLNKWVIADDSGLVVPVLGGAPGVRSRRYASDDATDAENRQKLLKEMDGKLNLERSAYFECCLALASPKRIEKCVKGICEGYISIQERGRNGFGYDPLFIKNDYDKTFGEIEEATKNRISHRRKALEKLLSTLEKLMKTP